MRLTHLERLIPHRKVVHNLPGRDQQLEDILVYQLKENNLVARKFNARYGDTLVVTGSGFTSPANGLVVNVGGVPDAHRS